MSEREWQILNEILVMVDTVLYGPVFTEYHATRPRRADDAERTTVIERITTVKGTRREE